MSEICSTCGLPKDLCVCETIAKESQRITVKTEKRKFGKQYTIITGIDLKDLDSKDLLKKLKNNFACGGTIKDNHIELQGDHKQKAKRVLSKLGFPAELVDVK
jgi:translation initiation factor 1